MFKKDKGALAARKKKKDEVADDSGMNTEPKQSAALLRILKDFADLELPSNVQLQRHDDFNYMFIVNVDSGYWKGGTYRFNFNFPSQYPFAGPKVTLIDKIYHPNIDLDGGVCVSVLRPWKPTYSTQIVLFGLLFLFTHPNPNDPLNQDAAKDMRESPQQFAKNVQTSMRGGYVGNVFFERMDKYANFISISCSGSIL